MNFSKPFLQRPVMTSLVMGLIFLLGIFSFYRLPVTDLPDIEYPVLHVQTSYTGASPAVVDQMITTPLEKELAHLNGLKQISSQSKKGISTISLFFELNQDLNRSFQEVQIALQKAESFLPAHLEQRPSVYKEHLNQDDLIYFILTSPTASLATLHEVARQTIEKKLSLIEGVEKVSIYGAPYAVRVKVNPEKLASHGLTFDEIRETLRKATEKVPLGTLNTSEKKFTLEISGKVKNASDVAKIFVTSTVRIKDIAEVSDGLESEEIFRFFEKGKNSLAVILGIQKEKDANALYISKKIKKLLPEIKEELPSSMSFKLWFDKATWIQEAVSDVQFSLLFAFALVIVVVFFSLRRFRDTLVIAAALPLSLLGTFSLMSLFHFNLDLLSLLALTLSTGFVVDDAIVVLENIVRHQEKGLSPLKASLQGSKQISFTILSMTLSLSAVFIPLLFMGDMKGKLFREFSLTLIFAILVSGFVSISLTPVLCSRFLAPSQRKKSWLHGQFFSFYKNTLAWCLTHKKTTLCFFTLTVLSTLLCFRLLPVDLLPEEDRGFIWSVVQTPKGKKQDLEILQKNLFFILEKHPSVESFVSLSFQDSQIFLLKLFPSKKRISQEKTISELQTKFQSFPGVSVFMRGLQLITLPLQEAAKNSYMFVLRGVDAKEVEQNAEFLKKQLLNFGEFLNPSLDSEEKEPCLEISVFEEFSEKLAVSKQKIQTSLQSAYSGENSGHVEKGSVRYNILLELSSNNQKNTKSLSKLFLKTPSGKLVPFKALASWKEKIGSPTIYHFDGLPSVSLFFGLKEDSKSLQKSFSKIKTLAQKNFPASVSGRFLGLSEEIQKSLPQTLFLILLAILSMYVILGILYESFLHPLTILSSLPFACLGGVLTLLLFREPLSLYSMVGFLLLIGIVKKNGILMIDAALDLQRKEAFSPFQAILEASLIRFRPILMTTLAAIMGALPIALGLGHGGETRRGLGLVIVGGLLFSQILTLYVTPVLYLCLESFRKKSR